MSRGSLLRRLERLEALEKPRSRDEDSEQKMWLATARFRRVHENRNPDEFKAGDLLRLFRTQGKLEGATFEAARDMVLAWPTSPPSPAATERVLSKMVHEREEGTENMECPADWREAWETADELRERYAALPVETLSEWIVVQHEHEAEGGDGVAPGLRAEGEAYGLADALYRAAVGPDAEEITQDEQTRRLREILADSYYGERAWEVQQKIYAMATERNREDG